MGRQEPDMAYWAKLCRQHVSEEVDKSVALIIKRNAENKR